MKKKITISLDNVILSKIDKDVKNNYGKNRSNIIENILKDRYGSFVGTSVVIFCHDYKWDNRKYHFDIPKVFLEVRGETVIEKQINIFKNVGITHIILTISPEDKEYFKKNLKHFYDKLKIDFVEVGAEEKTGFALNKVLKEVEVGDNLIISNGDIYYGKLDLEEYYKYHQTQKSDFSFCLKFVLNPEQLGNVKINGNKILEFVDRPRASQMNLTNSGLYITTKDFLEKHDFGDYLERDFFPKLPEICNSIGYIYSGEWEHIQNDSAYERINGWLL